MERRQWILIIACLWLREVQGGALVPRDTTTSLQESFLNGFWDRIGNFMSGTLHLIGSFLPLRGMATIANDLGLPYANSVLEALTPTRYKPTVAVPRSQRRSDTTSDVPLEDNNYISMRDEMSSAIGALLGKGQCQQRLACLSGRHLAHVNGASSVALMVSTASSLLPEDFREPLSIVKNSIMYSDNCEQYEC